MAVKFRRIEDRKEPLGMLRRREAGSRERRRILPKLIILVVIVAAVAAYFAYYRPPRIVAPFMLHVESAEVATPVAGTVVWLAAKDVGRVEQGDVLARVSVRPETSDSAGARLTELRLRAATAAANVKSKEAGRRLLDVQLAEQQQALQVEQMRVQEQLKRAQTYAGEAQRLLKQRAEDLEKAQQLKKVDAVTNDDHVAAQRAAEAAEAELKMARSHVRALKSEVTAARDQLAQFGQTQQALREASENGIATAKESYQALLDAAEPQQDAFSKTGDEFIVRAPTSGILFELSVTENSSVQTGQYLLSLYKPESKVARAFVAVRHRDGLREGAKAHLHIEGRKASLDGEIVHISDRVVPLPSSLERRLGYGEPNVIAVDIRVSKEPDDGPSVPGEVGKAVIEK